MMRIKTMILCSILLAITMSVFSESLQESKREINEIYSRINYPVGTRKAAVKEIPSMVFIEGNSVIGQEVTPQSDYLTLNVADEDLMDVLQMVSLETGDSIVTEPIDFSTYKTTINVTNVHKHEVLNRILTPHDLRMRVVGDTIVISSNKSVSTLSLSTKRFLLMLSVSFVLGAGLGGLVTRRVHMMRYQNNK